MSKETLNIFMENVITQIGGRKFAFALLSVFIAGLFVIYDKMTVQEWMNFTMVVGGIYTTGNVAKSYIETKNTPTTNYVHEPESPIDFTAGQEAFLNPPSQLDSQSGKVDNRENL